MSCTDCGHEHEMDQQCQVYVQRGEYEGPCFCGGRGQVVDPEIDPHYKRRKAHGSQPLSSQ